MGSVSSARALAGALAAALLVVALFAAGPARALAPKDRTIVGDAMRAADAGEWERAFRIIRDVQDPLALKTLRFLRMVEGDGSESFEDIVHFMDANPGWPEQRRLQFIAEGRIVDPADHVLIGRFFDRRPPLTERGYIRYAQALLRAGRADEAIPIIRRIWVEGDFSSTESKKFYALYDRHLSEQDHIDRLDNLLWDYRRRSASRMLEVVPAGERRLAEARLRLQRRENGVDAAIRAVPGSLRNDPGLLFDRARWRRQKRRYNDTIELLLDPPAELGRPGMWWFEREYQIRRVLRARDFELAYALASRHGQSEGEGFAEAEWLAGWLALRFVSQPRRALQHFERLAAGVTRPISIARAAYWAARAAAALDDDEAATRWYERAASFPTAFYGQEAARELGRAPVLPGVVPPTAAARLAFESRELVRVARLLIEANAEAQLVPFLLRLAGDARTPGEVRLAGGLAAASGRGDLVTLVGKYAAYDGVIDPATAFPIPTYRRFLTPLPGQPDPSYLLAITRQESVFASNVVSRAGARGLMQLMPRTASLVAQDLGLDYNLGLLSGWPDYNIRLGGAYLERLLRCYREPIVAFAAYNAGPRRADDWMELHGDPRAGDRHALIDWMELIPFDETRNYVQRVAENREVYHQLRTTTPALAMLDPLPVMGPVRPTPLPALRPGFPPVAADTTAELADLEPGAGQAGVIPASFGNPPLPSRKPPDAHPPPVPAAKPDR